MKRFFLFLALGIVVVQLSPAALAQCNGYDQFQTGSGTTFDLGPGIGVVNFQGVPIDTSKYGNADTIIQRTSSGTSGQCNLSVFGMYLKSTNPVTLPDGSTADVYATINNTGGTTPPQPDALSPSTGSLTITSTSSDGGTFDSSLTVNANLIFVSPPGGNVNNPANPHQVAPGKTLVAVQVQFHNTPPSGYPGCLPADVFYVYQIAGAGHPHVVQAAVDTTCGGSATSAPRTGKSATSTTKLCLCRDVVLAPQ